MLYGFLGFEPGANGDTFHPRLPKDWPPLTITSIHLHDQVLDITAHADGRAEKKQSRKSRQAMKHILALLTAHLAPLAALQAADFIVADVGLTPAPIIVFKDAPPRTRDAAVTLASYIEKISGVKPAILDGDPQPVPERAIWVGVQPVVETLFPQIDFDFKHPEEIVIAANEKHVVIAGRDRWDPAKLDIVTKEGVIKGVQQEYGTINAVHTFMQDQLGVRWLWPGELGEDVPKSERIAISAPLEYRYHPQMRARGSMFNYCRLGNKGYGRSHEWTMRQRLQLDSLEIEGGHGFGDWWDRYHEKYPEIFALQPDGTRSGFPSPHNAKLCMSNPKVWELWLDEVAAELQQDPNRTVFNASPNDGWASGHCVCDKCSAWDHPDGEPRVFIWNKMNESRPATSDRDVTFANTLGELLKQKYPGKDYRVLMLSYGHSRPAPGEGAACGQCDHDHRREFLRPHRPGGSRIDTRRHLPSAV